MLEMFIALASFFGLLAVMTYGVFAYKDIIEKLDGQTRMIKNFRPQKEVEQSLEREVFELKKMLSCEEERRKKAEKELGKMHPLTSLTYEVRAER